MEERWKFQDMVRETKRKKMRGEFTGPTDVSTELFVKLVLKHQEREENWKRQDTERIKKRIEYRKKHPRIEREDRRWIAITKGQISEINSLSEYSLSKGSFYKDSLLKRQISEGNSLSEGSTF